VEFNEDFWVFLRESRAVDMESLCVVAGKQVWSVRVDLHILDNGGYELYIAY
jgi:exosome complex RNA-binding protein Rrp42 (RNase PH superfamily)